MLLLAACGCQSMHSHKGVHHAINQAYARPPIELPRELYKVALPDYVIEPPDILVVEAIHLVPKSPYHLRTGDIIGLHVPESQTHPNPPLIAAFPIHPGGVVNLGPGYGTVTVGGLTVEEAGTAVQEHLLANILKEADVTASLVEMSGTQQVAGQHLVGPDGTITLGAYGSTRVVGLSLAQAKTTIEQHLTQFLDKPEIAVDIFAYNSKVYYVITEGAGLGDSVTRFPITGNDTVLDAIANVNGLTQVSSKKIWVARPSATSDEVLVLPVDWQSVVAAGTTTTNYQLMPGDRVFVAENKLVAFDSNLAKIFAPLERAMGFTLLATGTVTRLSGPVLKGGGARNNNNGNGGF